MRLSQFVIHLHFHSYYILPRVSGNQRLCVKLSALMGEVVEEEVPLWHIPGRDACRFPWRAPGDVDRALPTQAARRLYPPGPVHEACRLGDLNALRAHLAAGGSVDALDGVRAQESFRIRVPPLPHPTSRRSGQGDHSLLHYAAGYGQEEVTRELLAAGAALEPLDKWGKAPADWAIQARPSRLPAAAPLTRGRRWAPAARWSSWWRRGCGAA